MDRAAVYECDQPVHVEGHVLHRPANLGLRFPLRLAFPSVTYRATPFREVVHGIVRAGRADGGRPERLRHPVASRPSWWRSRTTASSACTGRRRSGRRSRVASTRILEQRRSRRAGGSITTPSGSICPSGPRQPRPSGCPYRMVSGGRKSWSVPSPGLLQPTHPARRRRNHPIRLQNRFHEATTLYRLSPEGSAPACDFRR